MKLTDQQGGFTIVETLIVLAVVSSLFVIAVINMVSYLKRDAFSTALNNTQEQIQSEINSTENGQYVTMANSNGLYCNNAPTVPHVYSLGNSNNTQGTNIGCEFIGTALRLGYENSNNSPTKSISFYPLVINECDNAGIPPCTETISDLSATSNRVAPLSTGFSPPLGTTYDLENGLSLADVSINGSVQNSTPNTKQSIVVFGYSFDNLVASSPSTHFILYGLYSLGCSNIYNCLYKGQLEVGAGAVNNITLCLASTNNNQYAEIMIGNSDTVGGLGVTTKILAGGMTC